MNISDYFDKVYLLNLHKRTDRLLKSTDKMQQANISFERFGATDGSVMNQIWQSFSKDNKYFSNPNYLGCAISHLSIYQDALDKGYSKILIVEDDICIHKDANNLFSSVIKTVPDWELLYLGFIPLSDDMNWWNYKIFDIIKPGVAQAKNFWGLYGYGISKELMQETLQIYNQEFPMELDRYFVNYIQTKGKSYGIIPQIFAAADGDYSDNSGIIETGMMQRSVDARFAKISDYI